MRSKPESDRGPMACAQSAGPTGLAGEPEMQPERETEATEGCQATFTSVGGCSPGDIEGPIEFLPVGLEYAEEISEWMDYIHHKLFSEFLIPIEILEPEPEPIDCAGPTCDPDFDWDW